MIDTIQIKKVWLRVRADESGATAIEYALICAIIATVIIGISATGGSLTGLYNRLTNIVAALGG